LELVAAQLSKIKTSSNNNQLLITNLLEEVAALETFKKVKLALRSLINKITMLL
jgi:hypothetical protein